MSRRLDPLRSTPAAVRRRVSGLGQRVTGQIRADLRADPYLAWILGLSLLLAGFGIWHRAPNFATRDERWRLVDAMEAMGFLIEDPSFDGLKDGVSFWRVYGATFYLYGLAVIPLVAFVLATGQSGILVDVAHHSPGSYWHYWQRVPAWFWTTAILLGRLVNVLAAVGCVYVLYRIGTVVESRAAGRLAATLLSVTWVFLLLAHEIGEDVPALLGLLVVVYLAIRYVETGDRRTFYLGCVVGGVAIGLKLTAGVAAVVLGVAHLLRARRTDGTWYRAAFQPRFLLGGVGIAVVTILASYPSVVVGAADHFGARVVRGIENRGSSHGWRVEPSWWWILRGYLHGLGLPLAAGVFAGTLAILPRLRLRNRSLSADGCRLAAVAVATYLVTYAPWAYVRTHHLLPTVPLLLLLFAVAVVRVRPRAPGAVNLLVAALLVSTAAYAGAGTVGYADEPRDQATRWLATHAGPNETVETYVKDPQDAAVPHDARTYHPGNRTMMVEGTPRAPPETLWMRSMPERCPTYIQLNYQTSLQYLADPNVSERASRLSHPRVKAYIQRLLAEDTYPYEVAARFGTPPRFLDDSQRLPELLRVGLRPRTAQYGDPQDLGVIQYTVILERTGDCQPEERSPLRPENALNTTDSS